MAHGFSHFTGIGDVVLVNLREALAAAVLVEIRIPGQVEQARCIAQSMGMVIAMAAVVLKSGEGRHRLVTGRAGKIAIDGKTALVK